MTMKIRIRIGAITFQMNVSVSAFLTLLCITVGSTSEVTLTNKKFISNITHREAAEETTTTATTSVQQGRIIGGKEASIFNYPYIVSIQYRETHICGGSIIRSNTILSAAHCVEPLKNTTDLWIRAGSSFLNHGGQYVPVMDFIYNTKYNYDNLEYDIALLILYKPLTFSHTVQPIALAEPEDYLPDGSKVRVTGWGTTKLDKHLPSRILHTVNVYTINRTVCDNIYKNFVRITKNMFCAAYPNGGKDSCQGDSGGPLVYPSYSITKEKRRRYLSSTIKQYGIVSFGVSCATDEYPGVYVNISALRPWINENIEIISSKYLP